jgi:cardiolipin synthase
VEGPAVAGLNHIFLEDWYFSTQQAIADPDREAHEPTSGGSDIAVISSGPDSEPWIHDAYFLAFTRAERRLYIATPYFIPTTALLTALRTAAGRGVDVHLIVPHFSDVKIVRWASRSYYQTLVEAGVRIFEYQGPMLHAKALVMDDLCSVGTANIDPRSMRLNFEVCCFVQDARMTEELRAWLEDLSHTSVEMTQARLAKVGLAQSLLESAAHVMSPLL